MGNKHGVGDEASKGLVDCSLTDVMIVRKRWLAPKVISSEIGLTDGSRNGAASDGAPARFMRVAPS